jgi:hypothetical protein
MWDELWFVIRCFFVAGIFTILLQVKTAEGPLEAKMNHWLHSSSVSLYLQTSAAGAVQALKNLYASAQTVGQSGKDGFKEGAAEQAKK